MLCYIGVEAMLPGCLFFIRIQFFFTLTIVFSLRVLYFMLGVDFYIEDINNELRK